MLRAFLSITIISGAITIWAADDAVWPPRPEPRIELRGSEQGGSFVEDTPGWAPHLISLFLTEKNPDAPWQSASQNIRWAHTPSHSYVSDGSGAYVIIAHPSDRQFEQIISLDLDAMEVNHSGNADPFEGLWDRVLTWRLQRRLEPIWGTGADDTHSITNIDRSWIGLRLQSLTEASVKAALRRGAFYASNGPVIRDIQVEGATINLSLGQKADVRWLRSGQFGIGPPQVGREQGRNRCLKFDSGVERSSYTLNANDGTADPSALFVRCIVTTGESGKAAQTQPFVIRSSSRVANPYAGGGSWHKGMTHNHTDLLEGREDQIRQYASAYAARGHSAAFETPYDYWVTPMTRNPAGRSPVIEEVVPRAITEGARVSLEIRGKEFREGCKVFVDGQEVSSSRDASGTVIRMTNGGNLAAGFHEVTVKNPDAMQDTRTQGFIIRRKDAALEGWSSYTPSNSPLGSRYVYSVAADPTKGVWIGTNRGINYFDGKTWKLVREESGGKLDDTIYDLDTSSPEGTVWFTCFRGVGALHRDGTRDRWTWREAGFPGHQVNQVLRAGEATYISTHNRQGFFVFRNGNWDRVRLPAGVRGLVNGIAQAPDGCLWLGTSAGVLRWDPVQGEEGWKSYTRANSGLPDDFVRRIAFDRQGRLWVGTATASESDSGGLCMFVNGRWTVFSPANSPLPERRVWSVFVDQTDRVWAATSKGVACLHPDGRWSVFNVRNSGLTDDLVTDVAQDKLGNLWFTTSYGVSRLTPKDAF
jgi:hypothetical protein